MKSSRVLGYGLAVWLGMVGISLILLPAEGKHEALYESIKLTAMVALVLGFAIRYLRRRPMAAGPEGVLVGLVWAAVTTAGDLGLYLGGAFNIGLDVYFTDVASSYAVMPVITGLAIGLLAPKPTGILSAEAYGAALAARPAGHSDADQFAAMMAAATTAPADLPSPPAHAAATGDAATEIHAAPQLNTGAGTRADASAGLETTQVHTGPADASARPEAAQVHTGPADAPAGPEAAQAHAGPQADAAPENAETHAEAQGDVGPEIHTAPESAGKPVVPAPAAASHAEATLVGAAASTHAGEETDRPLYIPRGNC